jgi:4-carboxymuconolactone decarboxylase
MTDDESALYALTTELMRNKGVSDETYARAVARFGERGVVEAVSIQGYYTLLAMVMNTARTPRAAGGPPPLRALP